MKELSIEEKAKAYDEAVINGSRLWECGQITRENYEYIFPELKENEDELTWLTKYIEEEAYSLSIDIRDNEDRIKLKKLQKALAWLEKQGEQKSVIKFNVGDLVKNTNHCKNPIYRIVGIDKECYICESDDVSLGDKAVMLFAFDNPYLRLVEQKPTDKVEPKFNEGEWLCENEPNNYARFIQILETVNVQGKERYRVSRDIHNDEDIVEFNFVEKYYHKFNIQDAKEGDVLAYNDGSLTIFRYRLSGLDAGLYMSHVLLTDKMEFKQTCAINNVHPATKEQRDTLMKAIADAGYTFDFEKKELKKIEQNPVEWSEEDETHLRDAIYAAENIYTDKCGKEELVDWLKSLRPQSSADLPKWRRLPLSDVCYTDDSCCVMDVITSTVGGNSTAVSSLVKGNYYVPLFELEKLIKKEE